MPRLRSGSFVKRRAVMVVLVLVVCAAGCRSTRFPEDPEAHPLYEELQAAPHRYYFLVRTGVCSRLLGLLPDEKRRQQLMRIKRRWAAVDRWQTAEALLDYFRAHGLTPTAKRVAVTLEANAPNAPPGGARKRLEAGAIKVGLLQAYYTARRARE